jgi:hypothetical protein
MKIATCDENDVIATIVSNNCLFNSIKLALGCVDLFTYNYKKCLFLVRLSGCYTVHCYTVRFLYCPIDILFIVILFIVILPY